METAASMSLALPARRCRKGGAKSSGAPEALGPLLGGLCAAAAERRLRPVDILVGPRGVDGGRLPRREALRVFLRQPRQRAGLRRAQVEDAVAWLCDASGNVDVRDVCAYADQYARAQRQ